MPDMDSPAPLIPPSTGRPGAMVRAYVGLGANLGHAAHTVRTAAAALNDMPDVAGLRLSPLYETAPVDSEGPNYVNAVAELLTGLSPLDLLDILQGIEQAHGRRRPYPNAPRTLDLDLLWYGGQTIALPQLTVPHPRMHERAFVLRPLMDLAPDMHLPQGAVSQLMTRCAQQDIRRLPTP